MSFYSVLRYICMHFSVSNGASFKSLSCHSCVNKIIFDLSMVQFLPQKIVLPSLKLLKMWILYCINASILLWLVGWLILDTNLIFYMRFLLSNKKTKPKQTKQNKTKQNTKIKTSGTFFILLVSECLFYRSLT